MMRCVESDIESCDIYQHMLVKWFITAYFPPNVNRKKEFHRVKGVQGQF